LKFTRIPVNFTLMPSALNLLRQLSPLGPIFDKELRTTSRRRRTYILRFCYLGALLLILLAFYSVMRMDVDHAGSVARRAQKLAEMGAIFFAVFAFFSLAAMAIAGPVLTATAINSEKLHKTLPVLLMTPISAWQIVAGKLFSRLLIALTLLGLSLPVLAIVRLLGGVEINQMFGAICLCIAVALFTASVGLLLSTMLNGAYSVILVSYAFLAFLWLFVPFCVGMIVNAIAGNTPGPPKFFFTLMDIAAVGHPLLPMVILAVPERPPFRLPSWEWCVLVYVGLSAVLTILAALNLRRHARKEGESSVPVAPPAVNVPLSPLPPPMPDATAFSPPILAAPYHPASAALGHIRAVSDHPVLWRETRRPLFGRRWQSIAAAAVTVGLLLFVYLLMASNNALGDAEAQIGFSFVFCGMLNVLACVIAATAIAQEKESDTWTLLLATPLSAQQIVLGKLLGILRRLAPLCAIITLHFLLFLLGRVIDGRTFLVIIYLTITTNLIWVVSGLYLSLRFKRVTFAVMLNLLGPLILYALPALILAIVTADGDAAEIVGLYCPYPYMGSGIEYFNSTYSRDLWLPVYDRVTEGEFFQAVLLAGVGHTLVSAAILAYTIRRFDRIVERAPQTTPLPPQSPLLATTG
jgi:ABC-type transport system involved in multi-copper enzyme maturation permease subunit